MKLSIEQVKLISLGMNIKRRENKLMKEGLSEFENGLFEKERIKAENDYFDLWFELNREQLEDKYIVMRIEEGEQEQDVIEEVMSGFHKYQDYCWEMCFKNL